MHSLFFCSIHPLNLTPERDGTGARDTGRRKIHIHPIYRETDCLLNEIPQNKLTSKLCPKKHQHEQFKHCQFSMFCFTIFTLVKSSNMWHLPCMSQGQDGKNFFHLSPKQEEIAKWIFTFCFHHFPAVLKNSNPKKEAVG